MYQVLIVDDESHIVKGIKLSVNWTSLQVTSVHEAYNVRRAKEIFASNPIDILICDIEMPQGNGLELLAWVKEHYPQTECIFLTCHADFAYAKKAIQLGSLDYLLKPVPDEELQAVVAKAICRIVKTKEQLTFQTTYKRYHELWEKHQPLLVERFWQDLLQQSIPAERNQIVEQLELRNLPYSEDETFIPILISVHHWEKQLTPREEKILEYALRNSAEELFAENSLKCQLVQVRSGGLLAIVTVKQAELTELHADLTKVCSSYVKACRTYFYCQLSCYIGIPSEIERILGSYRLLTQAERNNVPSNGRVYRIGDTDSRKDAVPEAPVGVWAEILKNGAKAKLLEHIRQFMQLWKQAQSLDGSRLQRFYQDFLHMLYHTLQLKGLQAFEVFRDAMSQERALLVVRSVNALEEWALEMAEKAFVHVREAEERQSVVEQVRQYIQLNIDHELTREELGKHVGFNADYIAKLFKKESGLSINDYVIQERVALAEQLLSSTDLPVNSVALAVGYSNFSYFSKVFRKATNLNPQQFRKQRIGALNR